MVEFKIGKDGSPYLMEINGRLWGSLQLAIDSGVDFPWLLYQAAVGKPPSSQAQYRCGQRLRWLMGDVDNLLIQLRASGQPVSSKLSAIGRFLTAFFDGSRQEILRWDDAGPAVFEFKAWAKALL
jgi:predicted ATP-grasp superfamily ATP-dependent carboligase